MRRRFLVMFLVWVFLPVRSVLADGPCTVIVSPSSVEVNGTRNLNFLVTNTGGSEIGSVNFQSSNVDTLNVTGGNAEGWNTAGATGNSAYFNGTSFANPNSVVFEVMVAGVSLGSVTWTATVTDYGGGGLGSCSGDLSTNVVEPAVLPQISNANLTVGNSSATLSWNTDVVTTGTVNYGTSSGYGSSGTSGSGTSHSVTMSGLSASTTYHYQISVVGSGGTTSTSDAIFTTSAANVTTTVTTTVNTTVTETKTFTKVLTDTTPPTVTINKLEKRINESAPVITGGAIDDRGVARVEYQVVGKDSVWISASLNEEVGSKKVTWEALPSLSLDGTYKLKVRGVDVFGNGGVAREIEFVIDQLPPTVGGGVLNLGALIISENGSGVIEVIEGVEYEVVLFENGGADDLKFSIGDQDLELKKIGSGLWRGLIKFKTGDWVAKVSAKDGAENTTSRNWAKVKVLPSGNVLRNKEVVKEGVVKVMWLDPTFKRYSLWEGADYGQQAEKKLGDKEVLSWILPKGEYYLEALVDGKGIVSQKIVLDKTTNVTGNWEIGKSEGNFFKKLLANLGWKSLVKFDYLLADNNVAWRKLEVAREQWIGKSSVVLVTSMDLPRAGETLREAKKLSEINGSNLMVVGLQRSEDELKTWVGNLTSNIFADYKGEWLERMKVGILPQLYEVDSRGEIVREKVGVIK